MPAHVTNYGSFELPDVGFEDQTLHLVRKKLRVKGQEARLMVARTKAPEGGSLDGMVEAHVNEQAKHHAAYAVLGTKPRRVADEPAIDVEVSFRDGGQALYQRQVHLTRGGAWVSFTMTAPLAEREACHELLDHIVASYRPRA